MSKFHPIVHDVTFKDICDFPGYCVGDNGTIWSRWGSGFSAHKMVERWRQLKPSLASKYPRVTLMRNGTRNCLLVQRIVLESFIGPCPNGMECCHDPDPNVSNCRLSNLRWDTRKNNIKDKLCNGTHQFGIKHPMARLTEKDVKEIRILRKLGINQSELSSRFKVSKSTIYCIEKRKIWKHID